MEALLLLFLIITTAHAMTNIVLLLDDKTVKTICNYIQKYRNIYMKMNDVMIKRVIDS